MRSSSIHRLVSAVLIYSLIGQSLLASPLQNLPANTVGFVRWAATDDKQQAKNIAEWFKNAFDTVISQDEDPAQTEAVHDAIQLVRFLGSASGAVGMLELETAGGAREPYFIGSFNLGALAPRVTEIVERLCDYQDGELQRVTIAGRGYQQAQFLEGKLIFATKDGHLVGVYGGENIEGVVASLDKAEQSVLDSGRLQLAEKKIGKLDTSDFAAFVDIKRWVGLMTSLAGDDVPLELDVMLEELGISAIQTAALSITSTDTQMKTRAFIEVGDERAGFLKLWDHEPISEDDIRLIPEDALYGMALQFDLKMLYEELMRVLPEIAPEQAAGLEATMGMVHGMTNISVPNDLLPAIGDTWVIYESPDAGGFFFTGVSLVIDVNDKQALRDIVAQLIRVSTPLLQQVGGTPEVMSVQEDGNKIEYLVFRGLMVPVAPAACFVGDRVVLGLSPQVVKVSLQQVAGKGPSSTVLNHPDIKAAVKDLPKNAQSFYYTNTREAVRQIYWLQNLIKTGAASISPELMDPGTFATLPEQLAVTRNGFAGWTTDKDGLLFHSEGELQPMISSMGSLRLIAMAAAAGLPDLARARELARHAESQSNLRALWPAIYNYAHENNGDFPIATE